MLTTTTVNPLNNLWTTRLPLNEKAAIMIDGKEISAEIISLPSKPLNSAVVALKTEDAEVRWGAKYLPEEKVALFSYFPHWMSSDLAYAKNFCDGLYDPVSMNAEEAAAESY